MRETSVIQQAHNLMNCGYGLPQDLYKEFRATGEPRRMYEKLHQDVHRDKCPENRPQLAQSCRT